MLFLQPSTPLFNSGCMEEQDGILNTPICTHDTKFDKKHKHTKHQRWGTSPITKLWMHGGTGSPSWAPIYSDMHFCPITSNSSKDNTYYWRWTPPYLEQGCLLYSLLKIACCKTWLFMCPIYGIKTVFYELFYTISYAKPPPICSLS